MGTTTAQVSLYPLRQASIGPPIREAVRVLRQRGLHICVGEVSTHRVAHHLVPALVATAVGQSALGRIHRDGPAPAEDGLAGRWIRGE
jgi:hypothetical protein